VGHGVAVPHGVAQVVRVQQVADVGIDLAGLVMGRGAQVEDARLVAGGAQLVDDVGADEPGSAGDEHPHRDAASLSAL
jgi:hypothetical protein